MYLFTISLKVSQVHELFPKKFLELIKHEWKRDTDASKFGTPRIFELPEEVILNIYYDFKLIALFSEKP